MEKPNVILSDWRPSHELLWLFLILACFFAVNVATSAWFPAPWVDEVSYSDPAIRFVLGKGFTSAAWPSQGSWEFWASNCPLHQLLLIPWLRVFGISATAVRTFNFAVGSVGVFLLWAAAKRAGWIQGSAWRLGFVTLLLCGFGMTFLFRSGRPDGITFLVAAALALEFANGTSRWRKWYLAFLGVLVPWAGLQLGAYVFAVFLIGMFFSSRAIWTLALWVSFGILLGVILLVGMYAANGVAMRFLENTVASGHTLSGELAQLAVRRDSTAVSRATERFQGYLHSYRVWLLDPSYVWVVSSLLICSFCEWRQGLFTRKSPIFFGLVAGLGVPILVLLSGKYTLYYTWMGFLIVGVCSFAALSRLSSRQNPFMRFSALLPLLVAALIGLPQQVYRSVRGSRLDLVGVERFFRSNVAASDQVFVAAEAYYAAIGCSTETYFFGYSGGRGLREMPDEQRAKVSTMVINPENLDLCVKKLGGQWVAGPSYHLGGCPLSGASTLTVYHRAY